MEFRVITVYSSMDLYYVNRYLYGIQSNDVRGLFELIGGDGLGGLWVALESVGALGAEALSG